MVPRKNISTKLQPRAVHMLPLAMHAATERTLLNSSIEQHSTAQEQLYSTEMKRLAKATNSLVKN